MSDTNAECANVVDIVQKVRPYVERRDALDAERAELCKALEEKVLAWVVSCAQGVEGENDAEKAVNISRKLRSEIDQMRSRVRSKIEREEDESFVKKVNKGVVSFAKTVRRSKRELLAQEGNFKVFAGQKGLAVTHRQVARPLETNDVGKVMGMSKDVCVALRVLKMYTEANVLENLSKIYGQLNTLSPHDFKIEFSFEKKFDVVRDNGEIVVGVDTVVVPRWGPPEYGVEGVFRRASDEADIVCVYAHIKERLEEKENEIYASLTDFTAKKEELWAKFMDILGPYVVSESL